MTTTTTRPTAAPSAPDVLYCQRCGAVGAQLLERYSHGIAGFSEPGMRLCLLCPDTMACTERERLLTDTQRWGVGYGVVQG